MFLKESNLSEKVQKIASPLIIALFIILLLVLSYSRVEDSFSFVKYHFKSKLNDLLPNYSLYHHSLGEFLLRTSSFPLGNSASGWDTVLYLFPLFVFSDLLGGLSLKSMYLFTITTSLIFLFYFYCWVRRFWGKEAAFYAAFFLGFSSIFQEFARSGSYITYGLLIAIIWIIYFFGFKIERNLEDYFLLGLITGLTWYGYGTLRCLTLIALLYIGMQKGSFKKIGLFILGIVAVILPGLLIKFQFHNIKNYHGPFLWLIFDKESSFSPLNWNFNDFISVIFNNLNILFNVLLGGCPVFEPGVIDNAHAAFWNQWLIIPLLLGFKTLYQLKDRSSLRLWLLLIFIIFLTPCLLTSSVGYIAARRSLLYVIPSYALIGLGIKEIFIWIGNIQRRLPKALITFIFVFICSIFISSEQNFIDNHILNVKARDVGMIEFAQKIKQADYGGPIYYLEERPTLRALREGIYRFSLESDIMRVVMLEHGQERSIQSKNLNNGLDNEEGYIVKSPLIPQGIFESWCKRNELENRLLLESPVYLFQSAGYEPFKLYFVRKEKRESDRLIL